MDLELKSPAHGEKSSNLSLAELIGQLAMIKAIKISRKRKIRRTAVAVWVGRDFVCVDARAHVVVDVYIWLQFRRLISTMIPCVSDRKSQSRCIWHHMFVHRLQRASEMFYLFGPRKHIRRRGSNSDRKKGNEGGLRDEPINYLLIDFFISSRFSFSVMTLRLSSLGLKSKLSYQSASFQLFFIRH